MSEPERESMEVDVLFVGAGPATLSSAYHLMKQVEEHNETCEKRGEENLEATADDRRSRIESMQRGDVCTYTYTSGTTGPPKGVIQTNENMLSMLEQAEATALINADMRDGGLFLFLPLAHSFGRLIAPEEIAELIIWAHHNPVINGAVLHANLGQKES